MVMTHAHEKPWLWTQRHFVTTWTIFTSAVLMALAIDLPPRGPCMVKGYAGGHSLVHDERDGEISFMKCNDGFLNPDGNPHVACQGYPS